MNPKIEIEVTDKDGWKKTFSVQKSIFHIGSNATNDVVLETQRGSGVSARHAQLIALQDGSGYRLVNLGDTDILLGEHGDSTVAPRAVATVTGGSVLKLGDFTLIFHGNAPLASTTPVAESDTRIGLRFVPHEMQLPPNQTRNGTLILSNRGEQSGVQFDLELEGLDDDCFSLEPAPLLSAGSQAEVAVRFHHLGHKPLAGERVVTIRATAPKAYPNEETTATCTLDVRPYFMHTLRPVTSAASRLEPPIPNAEPPSVGAEPEPARAVEATERVAEPGWETVEETASEPAEATPPPEPEVAAQELETSAGPDDTLTPVECIPLADDAHVLTAADAAKVLAPDALVVAVDTTPPEPVQPVETAAAGAETSAEGDWLPEAGSEPAEADEETEVIVLKATPPPDIETAVEQAPATGSDDWWSEPETTTES